MFKAELVKRIMRIESYEELYRLLKSEDGLRRLCDIKPYEKPYHPSTLLRFRRRIGPEGIKSIMKRLTKQLNRMGILEVNTIAIDATFIKAYSRRDPEDSRRGYSDSEARLRKQGQNAVLGYGVHLAVDATSEMPLAVIVKPANVNEKKVAARLLHKALKHMRRPECLVADSQYSSKTFRDKVEQYGVEPIIPYPRNQRKGDKRVLHIDRKFRPYGPDRLKRLYGHRPAVERTVSRFKDPFGLRQLRTRGLRNVLVHVLFCLIAMLVTALSSIQLGHKDMIRSPVRLMKLTGMI